MAGPWSPLALQCGLAPTQFAHLVVAGATLRPQPHLPHLFTSSPPSSYMLAVPEASHGIVQLEWATLQEKCGKLALYSHSIS